ncbi:DUF427 domain-containing protein [Hoeflea ulvae]|uniref:DUF427 domain-containing protein n=1 Tax=Hoeflea ulvae TaxID=2983764 RepID=A0ABT3YJG0_9HYPH|nr:DUF427 domain-containing protein [Hoeflea ulvae]MCY0096037.1 DUF427 domain-containing protein [Hoeflea ulvae]
MRTPVCGTQREETGDTMQTSGSANTNFPMLEGAIRNPANPNHLMVIRPIKRTVRVYVDGTLIAETQNALRVMEMGKSLYDPAIYVPASDITADLEPLEKTSHCPIKGDASYVALNGNEIAWTYNNNLDISEQLAGHFAFWPDKVKITEGD